MVSVADTARECNKRDTYDDNNDDNDDDNDDDNNHNTVFSIMHYGS